MKNYEIQKVDNPEGYPFVVFSTSYVSPIEGISEIEGELENNFRGKVLFDLLLSNGLSSNRFLEADFDGKHFDYTSFKTLLEVNIEVRKELTEFYQKNVEYLKNSVLPNAHQYLIRNGKIL